MSDRMERLAVWVAWRALGWTCPNDNDQIIDAHTRLGDWLDGQPHFAGSIMQCPACHGRGILPQGFNSFPAGQPFSAASLNPDKCRTCNGGGLVRYTEVPDRRVEPVFVERKAA